MTIKLFKCQMCSNWYDPRNRTHCPTCGTIPVWAYGKRLQNFVMSATLGHIVPIVRGIRFPRQFGAMALDRLERFNALKPSHIFEHTHARLVKASTHAVRQAS
jgi:hypothetical protein